MLRVPALYVNALWLHNEESKQEATELDFVIPMKPAFEPFSAGRVYPFPQFMELLQEQAKPLLEAYVEGIRGRNVQERRLHLVGQLPAFRLYDDLAQLPPPAIISRSAGTAGAAPRMAVLPGRRPACSTAGCDIWVGRRDLRPLLR